VTHKFFHICKLCLANANGVLDLATSPQLHCNRNFFNNATVAAITTTTFIAAVAIVVETTITVDKLLSPALPMSSALPLLQDAITWLNYFFL